MSALVYVPQPEHRCAVLDPLGEYSFVPIGSVYQCKCGKSWVAKQNRPGRAYRLWVPESRLARRFRRRIQRRKEMSNEDSR